MKPGIEIVTEKKLIGKKTEMSFAANRTVELWQDFMPRRKEIGHALNEDLISMQVYNDSFSFADFDPYKPFEKWAAVEVSDFDNIPDGMESFILNPGLYAVFEYKGLSTDTAIFEYIFGVWLPASGYLLDRRPHFEVLGAKYRNNEPDSEETIWIPVRK